MSATSIIVIGFYMVVLFYLLNNRELDENGKPFGPNRYCYGENGDIRPRMVTWETI
jgi:hypothetical protein